MIGVNEIFHIREEEYDDWGIYLEEGGNGRVYPFAGNGEGTPRKRAAVKYYLRFVRLEGRALPARWLFLGAYELLTENGGCGDKCLYQWKAVDRFSAFIERLIVSYRANRGRGIGGAFTERGEVVSLLEKKYSDIKQGEKEGSRNGLTFAAWKKRVQSDAALWQEVLEGVNCSYVITNVATGQSYAGRKILAITFGARGVNVYFRMEGEEKLY